jgi:hypothetical protein
MEDKFFLEKVVYFMELVVVVNCCGFAFIFSFAFTTTTGGNSIVSWKLLAKNQDYKKKTKQNSITWAFYVPISSSCSPPLR